MGCTLGALRELAGAETSIPSQCNGNSELSPLQVMVKANSIEISFSCRTSLSKLPLPGRGLERFGVKGILVGSLEVKGFCFGSLLAGEMLSQRELPCAAVMA